MSTQGRRVGLPPSPFARNVAMPADLSSILSLEVPLIVEIAQRRMTVA